MDSAVGNPLLPARLLGFREILGCRLTMAMQLTPKPVLKIASAILPPGFGAADRRRYRDLNSNMRTTTTLLFLLFFISACDSDKVAKESKSEVDSLAVRLSNTAMERFQNHNLGRYESTDSLEVSLMELDKAIELEPSHTRFYVNKANILLELKRDEEGIQALKQAISIDPDFTEIFTMLGFIYDREGKKEIAQEWYQKALDGYDKRIEEDRFVINSKINKVFLLLFTQDEESARKAYENLKQEYPNNSEVEFMEQFLIGFDKEEFLNELYK